MKSGLLISILVIFYFQAFSQDCSLSVSYDITSSCPDASSGEIDLSVEGNQGMVSISWEDGSKGFTRRHLSKGTYHVTISDDSSCTIKETINVDEYGSGELEIVNNDNILVVNSRGGLKIKTVGWLYGSSFVSEKNRYKVEDNGTYRVIVHDQNNCLHSKTISVEL